MSITRWYFLALSVLFSFNTIAAPIVLNFSSGIYSGDNRTYKENGVTVTASYGFHTVRLNTLAWYETTNLITISADAGVFDLKSLDIANPAYLGLVFQSPKGGNVQVGSGATSLLFSGKEWTAINSFTVRTISNNSDILNQLDNIALSLYFDADFDGVPDGIDLCNSTPVLNSDNDNDGCDDASEDADDDNDGVPDAIDAEPLNSANNNVVPLPLNSNYKGIETRNSETAD